MKYHHVNCSLTNLAIRFPINIKAKQFHYKKKQYFGRYLMSCAILISKSVGSCVNINIVHGSGRKTFQERRRGYGCRVSTARIYLDISGLWNFIRLQLLKMSRYFNKILFKYIRLSSFNMVSFFV